MLGLDVIGVSWGDVGDVGKAAFPYVHATGKGIASAFGAGAAADALEHVEQQQGWLPATPPPATGTVTTTIENVAATTKAGKKAAADAKSKPAAATPTTPTAATKPTPKAAQTKSQGLSTGMIVGGVGLLGVVALILHRVLKG